MESSLAKESEEQGQNKVKVLLQRYQQMIQVKKQKQKRERGNKDFKVHKSPAVPYVMAEGELFEPQRRLNSTQRAHTPFEGRISNILIKGTEFKSGSKVPKATQISQFEMERKRRLNRSQQIKRGACNYKLVKKDGILYSTITNDSAMNYFKPKSIDMSNLRKSKSPQKVIQNDSDITELENKLGYDKTKTKRTLKDYLGGLRAAQSNSIAAAQHTRDIFFWKNRQILDSEMTQMNYDNSLEIAPFENEYAALTKDHKSSSKRK